MARYIYRIRPARPAMLREGPTPAERWPFRVALMRGLPVDDARR